MPSALVCRSAAAPAAPVLHRRVGVHHLRLRGARPWVLEQAFAPAGDGVALHRGGKRELRGAVHRQRRRLGAALVDAQAGRAGNVHHGAVEHLTALLVGVEAVVEERAQEASALRRAEANGLLGVRRGVWRVLHPGRQVTIGGQAESRDRPLRGAIQQFVGAALFEAAGERDLVAALAPPRLKPVSTVLRPRFNTSTRATPFDLAPSSGRRM